MLKGKKVCLYPPNQLAECLWESRDLLQFEIIHIFDSQQNLNEKEIVQILQQTDCLMVTEENTFTSLLPPFQEETMFYMSLLSNMKQLGKKIVSSELEKSTYLKVNNDTIQVEPLEYEYLFYEKEQICQHPLIMVAGIKGHRSIHEILERMQNCLKENHLDAMAFSNKLYSNVRKEEHSLKPFHAAEELKSDTIFLMEGLSKNYAIMQKDSISKEEREVYQLMKQLKPDMTILMVDGNDSWEMVKETIDLYQSWGMYVACGIIEQVVDPWQRVYMEEKLGIPILQWEGKEFEYQFLTLVLNYFRIEE